MIQDDIILNLIYFMKRYSVNARDRNDNNGDVNYADIAEQMKMILDEIRDGKAFMGVMDEEYSHQPFSNPEYATP